MPQIVEVVIRTMASVASWIIGLGLLSQARGRGRGVREPSWPSCRAILLPAAEALAPRAVNVQELRLGLVGRESRASEVA